MDVHGTLYTFISETKWVKVVRLTTLPPIDWHSWPSVYVARHPGLQLLSIAGIEVVDDRQHDASED